MGSMGKQDATVALDGLKESPRVVLVSNLSSAISIIDSNSNSKNNVVWVADQGAARAPLPIWCRNFVQFIKDVQMQHQQQQQRQVAGGGGGGREKRDEPPQLLQFSWPRVHIVQVSDDSTLFAPCKAATEKLLQSPKNAVSFFKRSLIVDRSWNDTLQWVNTGRFLQNAYTKQGRLQHLGMPVRTDIVQAIESQLLLLLRAAADNKMTLAHAIEEELPRTTDVAHFWPLQDDRVDGTVNRDDGRLRDTVSRAIADLRNVTIIADDSRNNNSSSNTHDHHHRALRLFVDTVGSGREEGRNTVQIDYVRQLLDTKIVVVAQRDGWEDHYR
jgi:hypothetical protein